MLLTAMLIHAAHPALKDTKEALKARELSYQDKVSYLQDAVNFAKELMGIEEQFKK